MAADPSRAKVLFVKGLERQRAGRLAEARDCYERGLQLAPGQPDALFLLGQVYFDTGYFTEGEQRMRQAIKAGPRADNYRRALAIQFFNTARFVEAQTLFEDAIRLNPAEAENYRGLAMTFEQLGRPADAIPRWRIFLEHDPRSADALGRLARLLVTENRVSEAVPVIDCWLSLEPNASAYALRAELNEKLGNDDTSLSDRMAAVTYAPDDALSRGKLGLALLKAGKVDEALEQFDESVRLAPEDAQLHFNRGVAYGRFGQSREAVSAYEAALKLSPDWPDCMINLANLYTDFERQEEALALYRRIIAVNPEHASALFNLGMLQVGVGQRKEAVEVLERALAVDPDNGLIAAHLLFQKMHLCRWDDLDHLARNVVSAIENNTADIPPFIVLSMPGTTSNLQRRCAENHSAWLTDPRKVNVNVCAADMPPRKRLRVGYLSSDFKAHATSWLMIEMLEAHDRTRFEIFALSYGLDDRSPMRARVVASVEHFVDLAGVSDREAVARIAALELDVLVDLKGYTEGNRCKLLQYRLAPIQINWLGYPGTLGAPWADCLIADAHVAPPENQWMFSERLLYLPGSYQPNCRVRDCGATPTRADEGLPEDAIVLCSFNQMYKITPEIFSVWLNVLRGVPQAVLWLWASNSWAEESLRRIAESSGVSTGRLVFAEGKPQAEHLARLQLADLALDTFPCNGHTTTSDALWAGVPVITLQGEAFAERVAGSLLAAAGLPELIAMDVAGYKSLILRFCRDAEFNGNVSEKTRGLREKSDLFDAKAFARKLEECFMQIDSNRFASKVGIDSK